MYEGEIASSALKDVILLIAYFYKNYECILQNEQALDVQIKNIVTTGKAESLFINEEAYTAK